MTTELKTALEECLTELNGLYAKYENLNQEEARNYSRAIQKCEVFLNNLNGNSGSIPDVESSPDEEQWKGDNRRLNGQDRRRPGDRRRVQSTSRRR